MKTAKLSSYVDGYLALRASLIKLRKWEIKCVRRFANYVDKKYERIVSRQLVLAYLESFKNPSLTRKFRETQYVRHFCHYLHQRDQRHFVPEYRFVPKPKSNFKPYIFTEDEVRRMMSYARNELWKGPQRLIVPAVYETIIGLMWVTGMRIQEVINLNLGDLDFEKNLIYIRETKFYKSRLLPVHESTMSALNSYVKERKSFGFPKEPERPLFFNWRMRRAKKWRYSTDAIHHKIRQIIVALNIKDKKTYRYARPYDLRHSFATARLQSIYQNLRHVEQRLPLIATYMGHAKLSYTQIYLHPSTQLMASLGKNFLTFFEREAV